MKFHRINLPERKKKDMQTTTSETLIMEKITEAIKKLDELKPKQVVVTSNLELYNELINIPYMSEEHVKFVPWLNGTYVLDLDKVKFKYTFPNILP